MRSSLDAESAARGAASAPVAGRDCVTTPRAASVRGYYRGKTAAIIDRYGPGPRVHYHLGLFGSSRLAPGETAEQVRAEIVAAQERLLERAFDDYWKAAIGTLPDYQQAAAQAGLALEQDLDVTAETSEFWRFSIAWAQAKMAEPTISAADRTRLARSISWHRLFLQGWREGGYQHRILRFRKQ